jgi:hypothetical protein
VTVDVFDSTDKSFRWAGVTVLCLMMDSLVLFPILLVGDAKCGRGAPAEECVQR